MGRRSDMLGVRRRQRDLSSLGLVSSENDGTEVLYELFFYLRRPAREIKPHPMKIEQNV